jgi:1-deoxy-D-xylulose 5-phosphate reductoisomerase
VKNIAVLGSTGSIGTQTLDVIRDNSHLFRGFYAYRTLMLICLLQQAIEFVPEYVPLFAMKQIPANKRSAISFTYKSIGRLPGHKRYGYPS